MSVGRRATGASERARPTSVLQRPLIGALLAVALTAACGGDRPAVWQDEGSHRWRALRVRGRSDGGFTLLEADRLGIGFRNVISEQARLDNRILAEGAGSALGDVDGDGLPDLFFAGVERPNALYRNLGDWRFEDVTERAGVAMPDRFCRGAVFADVEGDGDLDLLVAVHGGRNVLLLNDGSGVFAEAEDAGFESELGSTTLTLADVDGDRDLDLYVANYKRIQIGDLFSPEERAIRRVVVEGEYGYAVIPEFREHLRIESEGTVVKWWELGEPDEFYLNDGEGRFEVVAFTGGRVLDESGRPLADPPLDWGLTARFHDIDGDRDPDLYVTNDFTSPDRIWINDGSGRFAAMPPLALRETSLSSMAVDFSDIDRDGDFDFVTTDMLARDGRLRRSQSPSKAPDPTASTEIEARPQVNRNALQLNNGDGTFAEIARYGRLAASDWTWGALFLDVDLDGYEDLLVTTGHPWDQLDAETHERLAAMAQPVDWRRERALFPVLRQRNLAFRNGGDLRFEEAGAAWGFGTEEDISHGIAAADLDGDGDLDLVVTRLDASPAIYRNEAGAARVAVRLRGLAPNTQAIGALIRLTDSDLEQAKEVTSGGTYLSGSDPLYAFAASGLGPFSIEVIWPGGGRSIVPAAPDRLYEIREPAEDPSSGTTPVASPGGDDSPLFEDRSSELAHLHSEAPFDDFARQPLLPFQPSRLGPGVTWEDLDRDGDPDLLIGAGRGGRLGYFENRDGRLIPAPTGLPAAPADQTSLLALPDGRGGLGLLVGQMSYEATSPREALETPAVLRIPLAGGRGAGPISFGGRIEPAVAGYRTSAGPLALADWDGDGDLDLFVGGRIVPGDYPASAGSRFFENRDGVLSPSFALDELFRAVGMVSGAVFSDLDGDADPDLLLALEWGPVRVFRNEGGRFEEATESLGLSAYTGRWNGVTTGDLDGDGRPDILATGWGENTRYGPEANMPVTLFFADFNRDGTNDPIEAARDEALDGLAPLRDFETLRRALPFLRQRTQSWTAFARSTVADLIGPSLESAFRLDAATLRHTLFLNRGERFEAVPLPPEAQFAPSFGLGVADLDGDGNEDLFLAQNFYATEAGVARYAAGRSLLLLGDGTGTLAPVPAARSGLEVFGDARGVAFADFDRDGRIDLAVSQNGAETKLYRNVGAKPGLRIRLVGSPGNPDAIGARIRVIYHDRRGPVREVRAGSGYWSKDASAQIMGLQEGPVGVWVGWPDGHESETTVEPGALELTIRRSDAEG